MHVTAVELYRYVVTRTLYMHRERDFSIRNMEMLRVLII